MPTSEQPTSNPSHTPSQSSSNALQLSAAGVWPTHAVYWPFVLRLHCCVPGHAPNGFVIEQPRLIGVHTHAPPGHCASLFWQIAPGFDDAALQTHVSSWIVSQLSSSASQTSPFDSLACAGASSVVHVVQP